MNKKNFQREELDKKANQLDNKISLLTIASLASLAIAVTLSVKRETLLTNKKAAHKS